MSERKALTCLPSSVLPHPTVITEDPGTRITWRREHPGRPGGASRLSPCACRERRGGRSPRASPNWGEVGAACTGILSEAFWNSKKRLAQTGLQNAWNILSISANTLTCTRQYHCASPRVIPGLLQMIASWLTRVRGVWCRELRWEPSFLTLSANLCGVCGSHQGQQGTGLRVVTAGRGVLWGQPPGPPGVSLRNQPPLHFHP